MLPFVDISKEEEKLARCNDISLHIDFMRDCLSKRSSSQSIFKFLLTQRKENEEAYEPEMLSIGPYHYGNSKYQKLDMYKLEYLQGILNRRGEENADRYIHALMRLEKRARESYSRDADTKPCMGDFVEMMLLDGCFIIEFFRKYKMSKEELANDSVFRMKWLVEILCRDMLLFENQLPFFVLQKLFDMTRIDPGEELIELAIHCLNHCIAVSESSSYAINQPPGNVCHLLGLMYDSWCSSFAKAKYIEGSEHKNSSPCTEGSEHKYSSPYHVSMVTLQKVSSNLLQDEDVKDIEFIKSVNELEEDGIMFKKADDSSSWLDIKFQNGVMMIPALVVQDHTESLLRNLIAYEEYMIDPRYYGKVVTDYTTFMNCLVNSSKDVKTLRHEKIIKNLLGNDEVLSEMFNRISSNVSLNCPWFTYQTIFESVNNYCGKRRNRWIAELKRKYFYNPWSITAFLAATILLVLTLLQTIFSIL